MQAIQRLKLSDWSPSGARETLRGELYHVLKEHGEGDEAAFLRAAIGDDGTHADICEEPEIFAMTCLKVLGRVPGLSQ